MSDLCNRCYSLVLNSVWLPIGYKNAMDALSGFYSGKFKALNIEYNGNDVQAMEPMNWSDWSDLEVRPNDFFVKTVSKKIRIPTIILTTNFSKTIFKKKPLTLNNIRIRDKDTCQYTGRKLKAGEGSVDHVLPKSKGGDYSWGNLVYCDKEINKIKGNKLNSDIGLQLLREPQEPPIVPIHADIPNKHQDWSIFLTKTN